MIPYEVVSAMSISVINDKVALLYFLLEGTLYPIKYGFFALE